MLGTTNSKAILQANKTTHKSPRIMAGADWITEIRKMETTGQTMGLDETLNGLNATTENGIDVHMMLPAEYGAITILSASGYGNSGKLQDELDVQKRTTTGNATGIYFTIDRWEILAGYNTGTASKYLDTGTFYYPLSQTLAGWHGAKNVDFVAATGHQFANDPTVFICGKDGIFSWGRMMSGGIYKGDWTNAWYANEGGDAYDRPYSHNAVHSSRGIATPII